MRVVSPEAESSTQVLGPEPCAARGDFIRPYSAEAVALFGAAPPGVRMLCRYQVKSSQVANPRNAFCIEQRAAAKSKEARVRVFGLFLLLPRLAPVGLIAR